MTNTLAVYSKKKILTVRQLTEAAGKQGIELRFMGRGGYGFYPEKSSKAYFDAPLQYCLLIGAVGCDPNSLASFDAACKDKDETTAQVLLNTGALAWCQVYVNGFVFSKCPAQYKKIITSWSAAEDHPFIQSAKTQYLFENYSKRKEGKALIESVARIVAELTEGILVEHGAKPKTTPAKKPKPAIANSVVRQAPRQSASKKPTKAELKRNAQSLLLFAKGKAWRQLEKELLSGKEFPIDESDVLEAFSRCVVADQTKAVEVFLNLGIDINKSIRSMPPLVRAASELKFNMVRTLLENCADPNIVDEVSARTPLRTVIQIGADFSRLLHTKRIETYVAGDRDNQSLWLSERIRTDPNKNPVFEKIASALLNAGADPNIPDGEGFTPLDILASAHFPALVELLCKSNAKVTSGLESGRYALEQCIRYGDAKTLKLFLGNDINLSLPMSTGDNAVELAKKLKRNEMAKLLSSVKQGRRISLKASCTEAIPKEYRGVYRPDFGTTLENKKMIDRTGRENKKAFAEKYQKSWSMYEGNEIEITEHHFIIRTSSETRIFPTHFKQYERGNPCLHVVGTDGLMELVLTVPKTGLLFMQHWNYVKECGDDFFQVVWRRLK